MGKVLSLLYGVFAYLVFFLTFLYAIGFTEGMVVPKSINTVYDGITSPLGQSILINVLLLGAFGIQHSIMARPAFKKWWTKIIPEPVERSTFVLVGSLLLGLMMWQWRPIQDTFWKVEHDLVCAALRTISLLGWAMVLYSSFLIDHFELFGLKQVYLHWTGKTSSHPPFIVRSLYRYVRHPLMLGFMIAFWATPDMTYGHLLFCCVTTAYVLVALQLEERDLVAVIGKDYESYCKRTPMLIPLPTKGN